MQQFAISSMTLASLAQSTLTHCCWLDEDGSIAGRAREANLMALDPPPSNMSAFVCGIGCNHLCPRPLDRSPPSRRLFARVTRLHHSNLPANWRPGGAIAVGYARSVATRIASLDSDVQLSSLVVEPAYEVCQSIDHHSLHLLDDRISCMVHYRAICLDKVQRIEG